MKPSPDWSSLSLGELQAAAKGGDSAAQVELETRVRSFRKLADEGDVNCQILLETIKWSSLSWAELHAAVKAGDSAAQAELEMRINLYRKFADEGDGNSLVMLGMIYDTASNFIEGSKWWHRAADEGIVLALNVLADIYSQGRGVPVDHIEAFKWISLAAQNGVPALCEKLCEKRDRLKKVLAPDQVTEALRRIEFFRLRMRAKGGDAGALCKLGLMYCTGEGVKKDYREGVSWLTRAATLEDKQAQYNLGVLYESGLGVVKNFAEAAKWYRESARQGYAPAQSSLGGMYHDGCGVQRDYVEAADLFRKAAGQGQLLGDLGGPRRERALRPREGRVHGRGRESPRPFRGRERRNALPRRDRRASPRYPGQTLARASRA